MVYAAASPSLAVLEVLVHLDLSPDLLPDDYLLLAIDIPDDIEIKRLNPDELPFDWTSPDGSTARAVGEKWLDDGKSAVMVVPSVIVAEENNVLINPRHSDAARISENSSRRFEFDFRLLP